MKVLVIGSGGREHALVWKIAQSSILTKLYAAPGNAGMKNQAECVSIPADDIEGLLEFAKKEKIDLTVVGPEVPLVQGIADKFNEAGIKVFGPSAAAALLEGSKVFSKELMTKFKIPTAHYEVFSHVNEAKHYAVEAEMPVVVKADGLAAGKGVILCDTAEEAVSAISQMMEDKAFGDAGNKVIIEQKLEGEEISIFTFSDGENIIPLVTARDHKRAYDNDQGPNTGGMGAYSPNCSFSSEEINEMIDLAVKPMIEGMKKEGIPYQGILYTGLMITEDGPYVLEYNCRFGDPEAQVILPRLKSDILPVMLQIAEGELKIKDLDWDERPCMTVVLASGGYPGAYEKGFEIRGIESIDEDSAVVFHAGTATNESDEIVTSGGRILAVSSLGESLKDARESAYAAISKIQIDHSFYRKDIGQKASELSIKE